MHPQGWVNYVLHHHSDREFFAFASSDKLDKSIYYLRNHCPQYLSTQTMQHEYSLLHSPGQLGNPLPSRDQQSQPLIIASSIGKLYADGIPCRSDSPPS